MFVRKKRNPSGIVSVQVIDKSRGKYRVVKTIGSSSDVSVIESLYRKGIQWISDCPGQQDIFDNYRGHAFVFQHRKLCYFLKLGQAVKI